MAKTNHKPKGLRRFAGAHGSAAWRPISTAPKDGTQILCFEATTGAIFVGAYELWFKCGRGPLGPASKHYLWWVKRGEQSLYGGEDYEPQILQPEPTHWMRLPKPPNAKLRDAGESGVEQH